METKESVVRESNRDDDDVLLNTRDSGDDAPVEDAPVDENNRQETLLASNKNPKDKRKSAGIQKKVDPIWGGLG